MFAQTFAGCSQTIAKPLLLLNAHKLLLQTLTLLFAFARLNQTFAKTTQLNAYPSNLSVWFIARFRPV
jgi:hypothetical protein